MFQAKHDYKEMMPVLWFLKIWIWKYYFQLIKNLWYFLLIITGLKYGSVEGSLTDMRAFTRRGHFCSSFAHPVYSETRKIFWQSDQPGAPWIIKKQRLNAHRDVCSKQLCSKKGSGTPGIRGTWFHKTPDFNNQLNYLTKQSISRETFCLSFQ